MVYTWRIDNITVTSALITSATISFNNIANWDTNSNVLHMHLLDSAKGSAVLHRLLTIRRQLAASHRFHRIDLHHMQFPQRLCIG